jgi:hypothetical protein
MSQSDIYGTLQLFILLLILYLGNRSMLKMVRESRERTEAKRKLLNQ